LRVRCCACLLYAASCPPGLHSFPTRRSSDLSVQGLRARGGVLVDSLDWEGGTAVAHVRSVEPRALWVGLPDGTRRQLHTGPDKRSEEHTSELQSRFDLVCRLLLEKKKSHTKP